MRLQRNPDNGGTWQRSPTFPNDDQKKKKMKISSSSESHFFQIIHSSIIQDKRLGLPKKFIGKFGEELSEVAVVMVPSGTIWRVELRKAEGEISFESGWSEFIDYYSIRVGHFLLFRYDGNSHFHVFIFDMSASEIEYPCHTKDFEEPNHETVSQAPATEKIDSMEILNVRFPWMSRKEDEREDRVLANKQNESDRVAKYRHVTFRFNYEPEVISIPSDSDQSSAEPTDDVKARSFKQTSSRAEFSAHRENRRIEPDELDDLSLQEKASAGVPTTTSYSTASRATHVKEGAHEAARAFKSENPFRTIIMRSSYVGKPFAVHVPVDFGRTYFKHKTGSITLCVSDGRMWQVRCAFGDYYTKLTSGWRDFVLDNHLEEDDVCVFELVDRNNFEVNVSIFRVSGDVV